MMKTPTMLMAAMLAVSPLLPMAACAPAYARQHTMALPEARVSAGSGPASITLQPSSPAQPLQGRTFVLYRLFEAEPSAGQESVIYRFDPRTETAVKQAVASGLHVLVQDVTEQQAVDYVASLQDSQAALRGFQNDVRRLLQPAQGTSWTVTETDAAGSFVISGLDHGWYMVDEEGQALEGSHAAASLLMVGTAAPDALIRVKSDYPGLIKQIQEDDGDAGWNDLGDFQYGQRIPYRFETRVPEISGYDTYLMRFHDRLDAAIDFDPASVAVRMEKDGTEYTLASGEYEVFRGDGQETFAVTIPDIKAIALREFGGFGQTVELRYDGVFNEKILDRQEEGKQGFENTVRLEFSNDPDSSQTGFTPWDTVVCYTYRLNGIKHNEQDVKLADAGFRLYTDPDCTKELGVSKTGDVYLPSDQAEEIVTDAQGSFRLDGLDQGTYWLKETRAPAGYHKLKDPVEITISPEFVSDRHAYVPGGQGLTALKVTGDGRDLEADSTLTWANLRILNRTGSVLPSTGSAMTIVLLVSAAGLMAAGIRLGRRRG